MGFGIKLKLWFYYFVKQKKHWRLNFGVKDSKIRKSKNQIWGLEHQFWLARNQNWCLIINEIDQGFIK